MIWRLMMIGVIFVVEVLGSSSWCICLVMSEEECASICGLIWLAGSPGRSEKLNISAAKVLYE